MRKAIAIDFDGCLVENAWPEIGVPHLEVIRAAIKAKQDGAGLILWTCRVDERLAEAVTFCKSYGLEFDAVNCNLPERIQAYGVDCRKVNADEYWDDRAICMPVMLRNITYWQAVNRQQRERLEKETEDHQIINGVKPAFII